MANIARLRAVITTDKGEASRLAHGVAEITLNDRTHGFTIHAAPFAGADPKDRRHAWTLSIAPVSSIGQHGASFYGAIARVRIEPEDLERLCAGTHSLAMVPA